MKLLALLPKCLDINRDTLLLYKSNSLLYSTHEFGHIRWPHRPNHYLCSKKEWKKCKINNQPNVQFEWIKFNVRIHIESLDLAYAELERLPSHFEHPKIVLYSLCCRSPHIWHTSKNSQPVNRCTSPIQRSCLQPIRSLCRLARPALLWNYFEPRI